MTESGTDGATPSYTKAEAIMISWDGTSQREFKTQRDKLGMELEGYNFRVTNFNIPSAKPYQTTYQRLFEFLQYDDPGTLLVVYYGGHGEKNADNQLVWLCDEPNTPRELRGIPQVNWSALQTLFLHECTSPVLFLLDCCYAGASVHREESSSIVVALAATGFHDVAPVRGKDSFTTFLTKALREQRELGRNVHVPYLKTLVSAMLNNTDMLSAPGTKRRVTPDYFSFSHRTITLRVLPARTGTSHSTTILRTKRDWKATTREDDKAFPETLPRNQFVFINPQTPPSPRSENEAKSRLGRGMSEQSDTKRTANSPGKTTGTPPSSGRFRTPVMPRPRPVSPTSQTRHARWSRSRQRNGPETTSVVLMKEYQYSDLEESTIRLIGIHPAGHNEPVTCFIATYHMAQDPDYAALSWRSDRTSNDSPVQVAMRSGSARSDKVFVMENQTKFELAIDASLLEALRHLRDVTDTIVIWVDQLCMNPKNENETLMQRELIPEIFRRASDVMVWLGDGNDDSQSAMDFIPDLLNLDLVDNLIKEKLMPARWQALINLMQRPYFSRRWIFLELMLAKRVLLYCGGDFCEWVDFANAVVILGSRYDEIKLLFRAAMTLEQGIQTSELDSLVDPRSLAAYSIVETSREHFRRQSNGSSLATCNLETLVSRLPALQTWHPAAVIYALLPLATDRELWTFEESESPVEIFQQFMMYCTHASKSLDIVCRPWAPKNHTKTGPGTRSPYGTLSKADKLPSWIRQVNHLPFGEGSRTGRKNGDLFIGQPNRPYYTAAGQSAATPSFGHVDEDGERVLDGSLKVSGFVAGGITDCMGRSQDGTLPTDWVDLFRELGSQLEPDDSTDADFVPDHMWRTLVADRGPGGTPAPLWYHQACRHWVKEYPDDDITTSLIRDRKHSSMALEFIQRVRSVIWNRVLFTIQDAKGRILFGLGPPDIKAGVSREGVYDMYVCILHGCSVPVVLNSVEKGWAVVGECFVYGFMDGEAMQMSDYIGKTQEFLLV